VSGNQQAQSAGDSYLPDLCAPLAVLAIVLVSELAAITFTLARQTGWTFFFDDLAATSLLLLWISLTSAAVLCALRPHLARLSIRVGTALAFLAVTLDIIVISEVVYWLGRGYGAQIPGPVSHWFPGDHLFFLTRNVSVGLVSIALVLRYFYITDQWRKNVRREAESRVSALQARIRPHFLFNSMNTIASLTRTDPAAAEAAVEDLADLFRASINVADRETRIGDELETTRIYQRMEQQRLGDRLMIEWQIEDLPLQARIPGLTIQPLLENAIYHGIELLPGNGVVGIRGWCEGDMIYLSISNPLPPARRATQRDSNRIALDNIRERLNLAFGGRARLDIEETAEQYRVTIGFPCVK